MNEVLQNGMARVNPYPRHEYFGLIDQKEMISYDRKARAFHHFAYVLVIPVMSGRLGEPSGFKPRVVRPSGDNSRRLSAPKFLMLKQWDCKSEDKNCGCFIKFFKIEKLIDPKSR